MIAAGAVLFGSRLFLGDRPGTHATLWPMRAVILIPLLLLACLQAALCPDPGDVVFNAPPRVADIPLHPFPTPMEGARAIQRWSDDAPAACLSGPAKLHKAFLAAAPTPVPPIDAARRGRRDALRARASAAGECHRDPRAPPAASLG